MKHSVYSLLAFSVALLANTGCYHATIETGLTPSTETIEEPFASGWIYGLVPPNTISTQAKCKHGVAKVETQHSFVNSLVGIITLGIYTPMDIKVTCAASETSLLNGAEPDIILDETATDLDIQAAFARAARLAVESGNPVYVVY
jgi:hypothetical protein